MGYIILTGFAWAAFILTEFAWVHSFWLGSTGCIQFYQVHLGCIVLIGLAGCMHSDRVHLGAFILLAYVGSLIVMIGSCDSVHYYSCLTLFTDFLLVCVIHVTHIYSLANLLMMLHLVLMYQCPRLAGGWGVGGGSAGCRIFFSGLPTTKFESSCPTLETHTHSWTFGLLYLGRCPFYFGGPVVRDLNLI